MSWGIENARSREVRAVSRGRKSGFTLVELLVVISIIGMLMALLLPQIQSARETARGNTCRNNLRSIATALFNYSVRNGSYPGYMNVLLNETGTPFRSTMPNASNQVTPVSWAVMILPDIDRQPLFDQWRKDWQSATATTFSSKFMTDQYIEQFLCPSDPQPSKQNVTPISYVVNSGLRDAPASIPASGNTPAIPRDWQANGMFFDNYSEHPLINTSTTRGIMVYMRDEMVRDPKDKTILLTENIDASSYVIDLSGSSGSVTTTANAEAGIGTVWWPGQVQVTAGGNTPPMMTPVFTGGGGGGGGSGGGGGGGSGSGTSSATSIRINGNAGKGEMSVNGNNYEFCRPASRHPQMVNVAFAGQNVQSLRDNVSYFIFAKLNASDDEAVEMPGTQKSTKTFQTTYDTQHGFSSYQLGDADVNP